MVPMFKAISIKRHGLVGQLLVSLTPLLSTDASSIDRKCAEIRLPVDIRLLRRIEPVQ